MSIPWWNPHGSSLGFLLSHLEANLVKGGNLGLCFHYSNELLFFKLREQQVTPRIFHSQICCCCSRHCLEGKPAAPSSPSKPWRTKVGSLTLLWHNRLPHLPGQDQWLTISLLRSPAGRVILYAYWSKHLLAVAGYSLLQVEEDTYQALSYSRLHRTADSQVHVAALGHIIVFKAWCDSTKWHKSELPVTNCMLPCPFLHHGWAAARTLWDSGCTRRKTKK